MTPYARSEWERIHAPRHRSGTIAAARLIGAVLVLVVALVVSRG